MPKALCVIVISTLWLSVTTSFSQSGFDYPFRNPALPLEQRVEDLLAKMTLEEKVGQMQHEAKAIPRLGIPEYNWWNECLHGVARNGIATVFPQAIGMAATWDPELIGSEAGVISTEARAKHYEALRHDRRGIYEGLTFWSPNINIFRDPRWGRGQETYGEDPFLTSRIGVAFVEGLQGSDPRYLKVVSTPKHFAVHSGPEPLRHTFDARIPLRDLYDTYLPAFEACVREGGAYSVMGAYNRTLGEACCASRLLLQDNLRKRWGFPGYVVSDCWAISDIYMGHKLVKTAAEASAMAVKAGCDLSCGPEYGSLLEAVRKGFITEKEIDISVRRLMAARIRLGMFDPPEMVPYSKIPFSENNTHEHSELARRVAQESIVLLKNENGLLPLKKDIRSVAVIGPYADNTDVLLGNYNGTPSDPFTILRGITRKLTSKTRIGYERGVNPPELSIAFAPIGSRFLRPPKGHTGNGLLGEYFDNPELKGRPVLSRIDTTTTQYWDLGSPGGNVPADHFSVRWTGALLPAQSGLYRFAMETDDKGRLYIGGKLVIDNWDPYEVNVRKMYDVRLKRGQHYSLRIEYAEVKEYAGIRLQWLTVPDESESAGAIARAVKLAQSSDVVILVAGISPQLEGEEMPVELEGFKGGDRTSLGIPALQEKLIREVKAAGKPLVLVLTNGSALSVNWEKDNIPAILDAWYPGQEGGNAVADVIFGDYNPAGRLPVTFYRSVSDLPPFEDYQMEGRTYRYFRGEPLFPFGYGLSYTRFEYGSVATDRPRGAGADTVHVSVTLSNAGACDGDEVVQVYVRKPPAQEQGAIRSLCAFSRVHLEKGETRAVVIPVAVHSLRYFDEARGESVIGSGRYEFEVGASSSDIRGRASVELAGD